MIQLDTWLNKAETAARLGISERTLDRLTEAGKPPQRRMRPRPGRKPEPVYSPSDVEALQQAQNAPMIISPASPIGPRAAPADEMPPQLRAVLDLIGQLAAIAHQPAQLPPPARTEPPALFLTIPESAQYTGLSQAFIRRAIHERTLPALRDGQAWKITRADLDNFASSQNWRNQQQKEAICREHAPDVHRRKPAHKPKARAASNS